MYNFEYDIGLTKEGRPCIELPEDYEQNPEDRFFAIEVTRYMLQDLLKNKTEDLNNNTIHTMDEAEKLLGQIGDEVAKILFSGMERLGELKMMMTDNFHIKVNNIEERDALPEFNILYNNMIFNRIEGLKVAIFTLIDGVTHVERFELINGTTNKNWVKI